MLCQVIRTCKIGKILPPICFFTRETSSKKRLFSHLERFNHRWNPWNRLKILKFPWFDPNEFIMFPINQNWGVVFFYFKKEPERFEDYLLRVREAWSILLYQGNFSGRNSSFFLNFPNCFHLHTKIEKWMVENYFVKNYKFHFF